MKPELEPETGTRKTHLEILAKLEAQVSHLR